MTMLAIPGRNDWLFSARTVLAAALALYMVLALSLTTRSGPWRLSTLPGAIAALTRSLHP